MNDYSIFKPSLVLDLYLAPLRESSRNSAAKALFRMICSDYLRFAYEAYGGIAEDYYRMAYELYCQEKQNEQETD